MKRIILVLLVSVHLLDGSLEDVFREYKDPLGKVPEDTKNGGKEQRMRELFAMTSAEMELLDEINSMRRVIAGGVYKSAFGTVSQIVWHFLKKTIEFVVGLAKQIFSLEQVAKIITKFEDLLDGFGDFAVRTLDILENIARETIDMAEFIGCYIVRTVKKVFHAVTKFFANIFDSIGKRKKRWVVEELEKADADVPAPKGILSIPCPSNVFGKAKQMNLLTYNRRLAQLAMVNSDEFYKKNMTTVEYGGKTYRITAHGTFATYVITNLFGRTIAKFFTHIRVAYLAIKMWASQISSPFRDESQTRDRVHEMLFDDREEVGCYFSFIETICVIGPLKKRIGWMYEPGNATCIGCKYGCTDDLCNPSPEYFYLLREKYKNRLRPQIEKFEIVEGQDEEPPIRFNFMIDSAKGFEALFFITAVIVFFNAQRDCF